MLVDGIITGQDHHTFSYQQLELELRSIDTQDSAISSDYTASYRQENKTPTVTEWEFLYLKKQPHQLE